MVFIDISWGCLKTLIAVLVKKSENIKLECLQISKFLLFKII